MSTETNYPRRQKSEARGNLRSLPFEHVHNRILVPALLRLVGLFLLLLGQAQTGLPAVSEVGHRHDGHEDLVHARALHGNLHALDAQEHSHTIVSAEQGPALRASSHRVPEHQVIGLSIVSEIDVEETGHAWQIPFAEGSQWPNAPPGLTPSRAPPALLIA